MRVQKANPMQKMPKKCRRWRKIILYSSLSLFVSVSLWLTLLSNKEDKPKPRLYFTIQPCKQITLDNESFTLLWPKFSVILLMLKESSVADANQIEMTPMEKRELIQSLKQDLLDLHSLSLEDKNITSQDRLHIYKRTLISLWRHNTLKDADFLNIKEELEARPEINAWMIKNDFYGESTTLAWKAIDDFSESFFKSSALKHYGELRKVLINANQNTRSVRERSVWLLYFSFLYWIAIHEGILNSESQSDDILFQTWQNLPAQTVNDFRYFSMLEGPAQLPCTVKQLNDKQQKEHYIKLRENFLKKVLGSDYREEEQPSANIKERMESGEYML